MISKVQRNIPDAAFNRSIALPGSAGTVYTADWDFGASIPEGMEVEITMPDLNATQLPDTRTDKVHVCAGAAANPTTVIAAEVIVMTGASSAGATGVTKRFKLPSDCPRYVRLAVVGGTSIGDQTAKSATARVLF